MIDRLDAILRIKRGIANHPAIVQLRWSCLHKPGTH